MMQRRTRGLLFACISVFFLEGSGSPASGELLISLNARDFENGATAWPQENENTGIPGAFAVRGSPIQQRVGGAIAVIFDGVDDFFQGPATTPRLHDAGAPHSVELWAYQGNIRPEESLVSWGRRGGPDGTFAGFRWGSHRDYGAVSRWGPLDCGFQSLPAPGRWHHLVFAYDGTTQTVYVDGRLDSTKEVGTIDAHNGHPIVLGAELRADLSREGRFTRFSGALAKVRIHGSCLSADEVRQVFEDDRSAFQAPAPSRLPHLPLHRFSFGRAAGPAPDGTRVTDTMGGIEAIIRGQNATFRESGIHFGGGTSNEAAYVDLPNGIISAHENLTLEIWSTQDAPSDWSRLFSIGSTSVGEVAGPGGSFTGEEAFTLCLNVGGAPTRRIIRRKSMEPDISQWRETAAFPASDYGTQFHDVIIYDSALGHWSWFRNSELQECLPDPVGCSGLDDVNVWLGRSEFSNDRGFSGEISEVRIYNYPLQEPEIQNNYLVGPDGLSARKEVRQFVWQPGRGGSLSYRNEPDSNRWGTGLGGPHPDNPGTTVTFQDQSRNPLRLKLDSPVSLGVLNLARSTPTTLVPDGDASLRLDSGTTVPAAVVISSGSAAGTVALPVHLSTTTEIINLSPRVFEITGRLEGDGLLSKSGSGPVRLSGPLSSHTGNLEIRRGNLVLAADAARAAGSKAITILRPGRLVLDSREHVVTGTTIAGGGQVMHRGTGAFSVGAEGTLSGLNRVVIAPGAGPFESFGTIESTEALFLDGRGELQDGSATQLNGWLSLGQEAAGHLVVNGSANVAIDGLGHLNVGDTGKGLSTLHFRDGHMRCRELHIAKNHHTNGLLIQEGGVMEVRAAGGDSRVGGSFPGTENCWGGLVHRGGTFRSDGVTQVGAYGSGVLAIHGGQCLLRGHLVAGRFQGEAGHRSEGLIDVSGGLLSISGESNFLIVGDEGRGTLNIRRSGKVQCESALIGAGTPDYPGAGVVNLLVGGELALASLRQINRPRAVGILHLNGGLLRARASSADFISGLDAIRLGPHGVTIDTGEFDIAIGMPMAGFTGEGVRAIPVEDGGSGFFAPPLLKVIGDGQGATAIAEVEDGQVRAVVITNPGEGYTTPPEVEITGPGRDLRLGPPTLATPSSGGITKTGSGTLHLAAPCQISGLMQVSEGTLSTGPMFVGGRGGLTVKENASWRGSGVIEGPVRIDPGGSLTPDPDGGVSIAKDLDLHGTLSLNLSRVTGQFLKVQDALHLHSAQLDLSIPQGPNQTGPFILAQYGSLHGQFAEDVRLPDGWKIDYQYDGRNQIALIREAP